MSPVDRQTARDAARGADAPLAIVDLRGPRPGPTVALVAGVHGGKRAAVRALEQLARELPGTLIAGRVLLLPVANPPALGSGLAQLSPLDSLNLNRVFPGRADGRPTERLAHRILRDLVAPADLLVDLHGSDGEEMVGAFAYAARPGLDAHVDSAARALAEQWGTPRIVWDTEGPRTIATSRFLQTAAHLSGVPAITVFEASTTSDDPAATAAFVRGARRLLAAQGLIAPELAASPTATAPPPPTLHARREVTLAPASGDWTPLVRPGQPIRRGELLGRLVDSTGVSRPLHAMNAGAVLHVRHPARVPTGSAVTILASTPD